MAEEPTPKLVSAPNRMSDKERKADEKKTPSARSRFEAKPHDGIWATEEAETATRKEQIAAFKEYEGRSDIESRASILARETAAPGQFSEENVSTGSVDDGKAVKVTAPVVEETDEAKEEADSIGDVTALK